MIDFCLFCECFLKFYIEILYSQVSNKCNNNWWWWFLFCYCYRSFRSLSGCCCIQCQKVIKILIFFLVFFVIVYFFFFKIRTKFFLFCFPPFNVRNIYLFIFSLVCTKILMTSLFCFVQDYLMLSICHPFWCGRWSND